MIKPGTKFALILSIEEINYLLELLEPIAENAKGECPILDEVLQRFDDSCCELDENEEFIRT